ncbi:MAG: hypothetical protein ABJB74_21890 [Gemmatimonas sp.]
MIQGLLKVPIVAVLMALTAQSFPSASTHEIASSSADFGVCRKCHTVKVDNVPVSHYFDAASENFADHEDAESSEPAEGIRSALIRTVQFFTVSDDAEGKYRCEDCHTTTVGYEGSCGWEHTNNGCGTEESFAAVAALYKAVDSKDISAVQRLVSNSKLGFVVNHERQAVQILDCARDHTVGSLPVSAAMLKAIETH